jgi:uncharacterized membrane protein
MPVALIGALVGLAFALVEYVLFGTLIQRVELTGGSRDSKRVLDIVRKVQLVLFPVAGLIVGWMLESYGVL